MSKRKPFGRRGPAPQRPAAAPRPPAGKPAQAGPAPNPSQARPQPDGRHGGRAPHRPGRAHWLYGLHAVKAALANPERRCLRLVATADSAEELGDANSLRPEVMAREAIARLLPAGAVHQGVALLAEPLEDVSLDDVLIGLAGRDRAVVLVLDQVTDPQNVGAILRSAAAFDVDAVVVPDRNAPPETAAMAKAASGAVELVPLVRVVNLSRALAQLKDASFWIAGLAGEAAQTLAAADLSGKVALVLGAEGEGLRRLTRDQCDLLARLPISPRMESLNVSAAAAAALYELARTKR